MCAGAEGAGGGDGLISFTSEHFMPPFTSFKDYRRAALPEGFDEVVERRWEPGTVLDTHTHCFALKALVV